MNQLLHCTVGIYFVHTVFDQLVYRTFGSDTNGLVGCHSIRGIKRHQRNELVRAGNASWWCSLESLQFEPVSGIYDSCHGTSSVIQSEDIKRELKSLWIARSGLVEVQEEGGVVLNITVQCLAEQPPSQQLETV